MRKAIVIIICLLLFVIGVSQCTRSDYHLIDYKEIMYFGHDNYRIDRHTRYYYKDGFLNAKTDVRWDSTDSTFSEYGIRRYDDRIDTVETSWNYFHDTLDYTRKTIKTYSLDGVIMKNVTYDLSDSGWKEGVCTNYNASGQKTDESYHGQSFKWYYYDSLNRYTGQRDKNYSYLTIDTAVYSDDGLNVVWTRSRQNEDDSIPTLKWKILYKLDKHGRIIREESIDYDTIGYVRMNYTNTYKYNRRGQLVSKTTARDKTVYRYCRGLKTWELYYEDGLLDHVYRYKNDFRHKLPLERIAHYGGNYEFRGKEVRNNLLMFLLIITERVDQRLVWTYEKAK